MTQWTDLFQQIHFSLNIRFISEGLFDQQKLYEVGYLWLHSVNSMVVGKEYWSWVQIPLPATANFVIFLSLPFPFPSFFPTFPKEFSHFLQT